jgi:hypothetical protein
VPQGSAQGPALQRLAVLQAEVLAAVQRGDVRRRLGGAGGAAAVPARRGHLPLALQVLLVVGLRAGPRERMKCQSESPFRNPAACCTGLEALPYYLLPFATALLQLLL